MKHQFRTTVAFEWYSFPVSNISPAKSYSDAFCGSPQPFPKTCPRKLHQISPRLLPITSF